MEGRVWVNKGFYMFGNVFLFNFNRDILRCYKQGYDLQRVRVQGKLLVLLGRKKIYIVGRKFIKNIFVNVKQNKNK